MVEQVEHPFTAIFRKKVKQQSYYKAIIVAISIIKHIFY